MWETMHLPLGIAMVATAHFSQEVGSMGFVNDRFNFYSSPNTIRIIKLRVRRATHGARKEEMSNMGFFKFLSENLKGETIWEA
jgi:hypothetical protein